MANKTLTVKLKLNSSQFERQLTKVIKKLDNINNNANKITRSLATCSKVNTQLVTGAQRLHQAYSKTNTQISQIKNKMSGWATNANKITSFSKSTGTVLAGVLNVLKKIVTTYLGLMGMRAMIDTTDVLVGAQNKLNYVNANRLGDDVAYNADGTYSDATLNATQEALDKMYASSQKVRTSYLGMVDNVSKTMALAGDAFGGNIDNAIRFQEIMAEAYTVGGASAKEMESSMYQLTQALGAGVLAGDELRSVREGAPVAYQAIEKFAQGIYNTTDSLKEMASQGKITSDIVVAGIMDAGGELDRAFAQTRQTFGQTFDQLKNAAVYAFQPVMEMLTDTLQKAIKNGMIQKFELLFTTVSKIIMIVFTLISNVVLWFASAIDWVSDNFSTIVKVISIGLIVIGTIMTAVLFPKFIAWIKLMGYTIYYYAMIGWYALKAGLQAALGWLAAHTMLALVIAIILAVIVVVILMADSFQDACGMIVGAIAVAGAIIWNLVVGLVNSIIQFLWTMFVERWIGIIEWVLNVFNGGFNSFGDAVKNLLGNIISWFLSLGQVVTKIIDAIFGTNWTDGLEALKGKLLSWGKNETAITLNREAPSGLNRVAYGDAYNAGYEWGFDKSTALTDKLGSLTSGINLDNIGGKLGLDFSGMGNFPTDGVGKSSADEILKGVNNVDGNTGRMADSMDLTEEDLSYLRKVADMEWKKEFTTANINIKMDNNIQSDADYEGFVTRLRNDMYDEMVMIADGAYVY